MSSTMPQNVSDDHDDESIHWMLEQMQRNNLDDLLGDIKPMSAEERWQREQDATRHIEELEEFERQIETAAYIPLRQYLNYPSVIPSEELDPDEIASELERVLEMMAEHRIYVDTICEVDEAELYRFITQELLDEEIQNIRVGGFDQHYIYEEFHPNDEHDVKESVNMFLFDLLNHSALPEFGEHTADYLDHHFAEDDFCDEDGTPLSIELIREKITDFWRRNQAIDNTQIEVLTCQVETEYATAEAFAAWECDKPSQPGERVRVAGRSKFQLNRSPYGGWQITQMQIGGWNDIRMS